jgi:hypothetical protein
VRPEQQVPQERQRAAQLVSPQRELLAQWEQEQSEQQQLPARPVSPPREPEPLVAEQLEQEQPAGLPEQQAAQQQEPSARGRLASQPRESLEQERCLPEAASPQVEQQES